MTPAEWIMIGNLALQLGTKVAAGWQAINAKIKAGEPVTAEEVAQWFKDADYAKSVPNSAKIQELAAALPVA